MKKVLALVLALVMVVGLAACAKGDTGKKDDADKKGEGVMTHAEYVAAAVDTECVVEAYVQDHQSWWDNKITVYAQDKEGGYFFYNMACAEADAAKLTPGTKIRVTGFRGEWDGMIELMDAKFEILDGNYVASPVDVTSLLGKDELANHMSELVSFKGMKVEAYDDTGAAFVYANGEDGNDLYFKVSSNGATYEFCVESYLRGKGTDVYTAIEGLQVGQTVDLEGFLYWWNGPNPHITKCTVK